MKCIKCGREIADGELFCALCSHAPQHPQGQPPRAAKRNPAAEKSASRPTGRGKPPRPAAPQAGGTGRQASPQPQPERHRRQSVKLVVGLILVSLAAMGLVAFILCNWGDLALQKANLRVQEADLILREDEIETLKQTLSDTDGALTKAKADLAALEAENRSLKSQLSGTQSTVSQTQFDMTSQQQENEKLTQENEKLGKLAEDLEQENGTLLGKISALNATAAAYGAKADFMDRYVVFVNNDGSKYYHTYDCKEFNRKSFWAYSRKLAESNGFSACPTCGG